MSQDYNIKNKELHVQILLIVMLPSVVVFSGAGIKRTIVVNEKRL